VTIASSDDVSIVVGVNESSSNLGAAPSCTKFAAPVAAGVGTAAAVGTDVGVGTTSGRVMDAVIDHFVPWAKIVPVLPLTVPTPPNITVDPATVGYAVTVMLVPWSYLPDASGAGLKTS